MNIKTFIACAAAAAIASVSAQAADKVTAAEAEAMVKKAVAFIKQNGPDKAYAEFNNKKGAFTDRDLYIVVYGLDGKCLSHGANEKLIGKDLSEAQDVDGKYYVKERMDLAKAKQSFWQDYKFTNPVTKKIEPKQMYCQRLESTAVCGGIYKS
jgi:signal transduction histidine kinase